MASSTSRTLLALTIPVCFVAVYWLLKKRASRFRHLKEDKPENISSQLLYSMNLKGSVIDPIEFTEMPIPQSQGDTDNQSCIPALKGRKKVSKNASTPSLKSENSSVGLLNGKHSRAEKKSSKKCTGRTVAKDQSRKVHQPLPPVNGICKTSVCPTPATDELTTPAVNGTATAKQITPAVNGTATAKQITPAVNGTATAKQITPAVNGKATAEQTTPAVNGKATAEQTTPAVNGAATAEQTTPAVNGAATAELTTPAVNGAATAELTTPAVNGTATAELTTPAVNGTATAELTTPAVNGTATAELTTPAVNGIATAELTTPAVNGIATAELTTPAVNGTATAELTTPAVNGTATAELTTPAVNSTATDTNRHYKPEDIENSFFFSRLQNYRDFVPNRPMHPVNTYLVETRDSENRTVAETQDGASINNITEDLQNVDLSSQDFPSGDIDHTVAGMSAAVGYLMPSANGHYSPIDYSMPSTSSHVMSNDLMFLNGNQYGVDYTASPEPTYSDSLVSDDSGRGQSVSPNEESENPSMVYEFEIPQKYCGLMIGAEGRHVKYVASRSGTDVLVKNHPFDHDMKVCTVVGNNDGMLVGTGNQIKHALKLIRRRFPEREYPYMSLEQLAYTLPPYSCPGSCTLQLPEGVSFDAFLCCTVSAGHFFLQQPTHPTFYHMFTMRMQMNAFFSDESPKLDNPVRGNICVAILQNNWYRAEVVDVLPGGEACKLKFLDYGGYSIVPLRDIRQIHGQFMTIPFQATECLLAGIAPIGESWSEEAKSFFESLAQNQHLGVTIGGYTEDNIPCVYLFRNDGPSTVYINQEMVTRQFARVLPQE